LLEYSASELVFGLVYAVGTDYRSGVDCLSAQIRRVGYEPVEIRLSDYLAAITSTTWSSDQERIDGLMDRNEVRKRSGRGDFVALSAIAKIAADRRRKTGAKTPRPVGRTAYILYSLKHEEEVAALRQVYGPGFYLIGFFSPEAQRLHNLMHVQNVPKREAERLIGRDQGEPGDFGLSLRNRIHPVRRRPAYSGSAQAGLPARTGAVHLRLDRAIREQHQRSVWATANRAGSWPTLDVYYYLGVGTAIDAKKRTNPAADGLQELIANMIGDESLAPAHGFLRELQSNARTWRDQFIEAVTRIGESTFRPALKDAGDLWRRCSDRYGLGPGYRDDVADFIRAWFDHGDQVELYALLEQHVVRAWEQHFIARLGSLCDPAAAANSPAA
jgi:hypothetical protein